MAKENQTIPYSLEAEQCLLGSVLIDCDLQTDIITKLNSDDFYVESHRFIYNSMADLVSDGKMIDLVNLVVALSNLR